MWFFLFFIMAFLRLGQLGLLFITWMTLLIMVIAKRPIRVSSEFSRKRSRLTRETKKRAPSKSIIPVKRATAADKLSRSASLLQEYISHSTSMALSSVDNLRRDMKVFFASDYENLLLRLTRPNESRPLQADLERFLATTASFVRDFDLIDSNNPYRVTLRKLWRKLIESDPLTNIKAEYLLLSLIRNSEPEDALIYRKLFLKMSQEVDKKSGCQFFDWVGAKSSLSGKKVLLAKENSRSLKLSKNKISKKELAITSSPKDWTTKFAQSFFQYITLRMKCFTSDFQEMKVISLQMRAEDICAQVLVLVICISMCFYISLFLVCQGYESNGCLLTM